MQYSFNNTYSATNYPNFSCFEQSLQIFPIFVQFYLGGNFCTIYWVDCTKNRRKDPPRCRRSLPIVNWATSLDLNKIVSFNKRYLSRQVTTKITTKTDREYKNSNNKHQQKRHKHNHKKNHVRFVTKNENQK